MRASTEHQNYSTVHQEAALREYALTRQFEIVAVYRDEGRSGLTLDGRNGLVNLLDDVQSGKTDFTAILVYDVSRWGRFQDIDESAYYEFACRKAGIAIAYCAEPFANDGSPLATMLKAIKRAMAAEYSRELSSKVFRAQCRLTMAGYKQGGTAGYGLRRMAISASGQKRYLLAPGERKNSPTDRVVYVIGPEEEVAVVRRVYAMYVDEGLADCGIASRLNAEGIANQGGIWSDFHIKSILTNPKYAGTLVFNRGTQRLRSSRRPNDPDKWITLPNAFDGAVSQARFDQAKAERKRRRRSWTNDEMLDGLRDLLVKHGVVTPELINLSDLPSVKSYVFRFRSFVAALDAAGVAGTSVSRRTLTHFRLRCTAKDLAVELERYGTLAAGQIERLTCRTYRIAGVVVRLLCTRCRFERSHRCWKVTVAFDPAVDFIIWARMDEANEMVAQLYLLPTAQFPEHKYLWPSTRSLPTYQQFAYPSMAHIFGIGA
jgi:DNA invertase Pin-like site-specific DNA recombinase